LKDCFTSPLSRSTMIATVSPGASAADHTLNTLRYADRVKEKKIGARSEEAQREAKIESDAAKYNKMVRGGGGYVGEEDYLSNANSGSENDGLPAPPRRHAIDKRPSVNSPARNEFKQDRGGKVQRTPPTSPLRAPQGQRKNNLNDDDYGSGADEKYGSSPDNEHADDDIDLLHASLRGHKGTGSMHDDDDEEEGVAAELHRTVQKIFEDEENLLNLHMSIIQENAELLTSEGKLLQQVQGEDDYNIDDYATKLEAILDRKSLLITQLNDKLKAFRLSLAKEAKLSSIVNLRSY
jgi:kinesin family protein 2/24